MRHWRFLLIICCALLLAPGLRAEEKAKPKATPEQREAALKVTEKDHVLGKADAPVTIIEYASLSCPHCAAFHQTTLPQLQSKYIDTGKVKFAFRDFPFNAPALRGAMLTQCAGKEKYYTFLKVLFEQQSQWAFHRDYMGMLDKIARLGGIPPKAFEECMGNKAVEEQLIAAKQQAVEVLEVQSTPTFFVNGQILQGNRTADEFAAVIDPLLKAK